MVARLTVFEKPDDYVTFMRVMDAMWEIVSLLIYATVEMSNHFHPVLRSRPDLMSEWNVRFDEESGLCKSTNVNCMRVKVYQRAKHMPTTCVQMTETQGVSRCVDRALNFSAA